ncbi:25791_t:CDS:1 [Dentiscutata erythropus]|uniref:25791_t:CDS:1 n=1 Tax=Dentiscutata erythropus TaxID=1348616 RepID=A0A9N9D292_9GLOM|nr:25791_t:CDS:1 [Dentiscutata erythropus]
MSLPRQQRQRQRRGFYVTKACINCQQKHTKCSGEATCERCAQHSLECTFIESGKKRGPKTNGKRIKQIYFLNGPENDFNETSMLSNAEQGHTSTLPPSEYPQQQPDSLDEVTVYSYQAHTNSGYIMQNNNLIDNTSINNNNIFYLCEWFII